MGERFPILWFGKKSSELKEILETDKSLTETEKARLKEIIRLKELIEEKEEEERK